MTSEAIKNEFTFVSEEDRMYYELINRDVSVNIDEDLPPPPIAISCGTYVEFGKDIDIPIMTYGNFSFVQGPPKTMKSFFMSLLVARYLTNGNRNRFGSSLKSHRKDEIIVHFDTEQSKYHSLKGFRRSSIMSNNNTEGYFTFCLRELPAKHRLGFIKYKLKELSDFYKIGIVVIDGIADLISTDVNNTTESNECTQLLLTLTTVYYCHITTIIHSNYGSSKPTGHLGSFLEKRCETQIMLERNEVNKDEITVKCKRSRDRNFETFGFVIDEKNLPKVVEYEDIF